MENHFLNFTIKNFKGFKELKLENLGLFNFIVGDNNVGKTSLLEALLFDENPNVLAGRWNYLMQKIKKVDFSENFYYYLINRNIINYEHFAFPETIQFEIKNFENKENSYYISKNLKETEEIFLLNNLSNSAGSLNNGLDELFYQDLILKNEVIEKIPYIPVHLGYGNDLTELYGKYVQISSKKKEELKKNLKCLIPNITSIENSAILKNGFGTLVIEQSDKDALIPLGLFGDGVIKLFRLIMEIMQWSGQRLMIDEVENGLHHSKMKDFLETILHTAKNQNTQLFATTHNLECLQKLQEVLELHPEWQEHTRIIHLADTPKFGIKAYIYKYSEFEFAMENENELR